MTAHGPSRWWRRLRGVGYVLLALALLIVGRAWFAFRDRQPGYQLDLNRNPAHPGQVAPLQVGFGRIQINPPLNAGHPIWLAGFSQNRAATAIHDDLWAIACVLDDGQTRLGIVALDAIGFFHDDVIAVRRRVMGRARLDYVVICATHNHSTPDLLGLWGPHYLRTGVNPDYRQQVIAAAADALLQAEAARQPARLVLHEIPTAPAGLVTDSRKPLVLDPDIRVLQFVGITNWTTLGSVVTWGNHPETVWGRNTEITSDFCGYLREALERGVIVNGTNGLSGVSGTHLYINGAIGGLMTTSPSVTVKDPFSGADLKKPSHEKARALGWQLAVRILPRLMATNSPALTQVPIGVRARTIELPLDNPGYLLAPILGLIDRGHVRWKTIRSEVALLSLGPASIACIPGEIYPELVNGGVERAPGADFDLEPLEVPPIRAMMPGAVKFIFGLANDEVGYIIPKSEWDRKPPYLYGSRKPVYGEINSVGPDVALTIHRVLREFCEPPSQTVR